METNKRTDNNSERSNQRNNSGRRNPSSQTGFEGMNFEQQRGSYKNSDGAGVAGKDEEGRKAPKKD
jgi:hypothetical protein